jgi:hypothetical protein
MALFLNLSFFRRSSWIFVGSSEICYLAWHKRWDSMSSSVRRWWLALTLHVRAAPGLDHGSAFCIQHHRLRVQPYREKRVGRLELDTTHLFVSSSEPRMAINTHWVMLLCLTPSEHEYLGNRQTFAYTTAMKTLMLNYRQHLADTRTSTVIYTPQAKNFLLSQLIQQCYI